MKNYSHINMFRSLVMGLILYISSPGLYSQTFPINLLVSPSNPCVGELVTFTADTNGWGAGPLVTYSWYFTPGGAVSNNFTFSHVFSSAGGVGVYLTVHDSLNGRIGIGYDSIVVTTTCPQNTITGNVFNDANNNGIRDASETNAAFVNIGMGGGGPGTIHTYTDLNGDYSLRVDAGTYSLAAHPNTYRTVTAPSSGTYSVTFAGTGGTSSGNDFGIYTIPVTDVRATISASGVRPGFATHQWIHIVNLGSVPASGAVTLTFDSKLSYVSATPGPASQSGNTVTFNYSGLVPGYFNNYRVDLMASSSDSVGTPLSHHVVVDPVIGDSMPSNNYDTVNQIMVASLDPNDKLVSPAGIGATGRMTPTDQLEYTVRFQNIGTIYAENIRIEDEIDTDLDISSFTMLSSSHPYNYEVNGNKIIWYFDGIKLPDDKTDEPGSHGFVKYVINLVDPVNIPDFTTIENTADIYFDFNPAVVTNTTINTIDRSVLWDGIEDIDGNNKSRLYPNPFADKLEILMNNHTDVKVSIMNIGGQLVFEKTDQNKNHLTLDLDQLESGLYFVRIETTSGVDTYKTIKR